MGNLVFEFGLENGVFMIEDLSALDTLLSIITQTLCEMLLSNRYLTLPQEIVEFTIRFEFPKEADQVGQG